MSAIQTSQGVCEPVVLLDMDTNELHTAIENLSEAFASVPGMNDAYLEAVSTSLHRDLDLGPDVLEYYARSLERGLAQRDALDPAHFLDVDYRNFVVDPLGTARRIYAHYGLPLDQEAERQLAQHVADNPQGKHGKHEYTPEAFGLTAEIIRRRLAGYIERFGLPT